MTAKTNEPTAWQQAGDKFTCKNDGACLAEDFMSGKGYGKYFKNQKNAPCFNSKEAPTKFVSF